MHTQSIADTNNINTTIAQAWESFTDTGALNGSAIRKVIGNSWVKSRQLGIPTDKERAPTVITADEIAEIERTADLIKAIKPVLNKLEHILVDTQHVIVLADANSRILYSTGHRSIQEKLENINFRPGADWSEQLVGPNGVGTSLALGRPEIVMGYEHYCKAWQPWVCYGAPIYDASGRNVKGIIDITGPVEHASNESMAMAIALAQSVTGNLAVQQFRKRERLREHGKYLLQKWRTDSVLILDEYAAIVDFNSKASLFFKHVANELINKSIFDFIPDIGNAVTECIATGDQVTLEIHKLQHADTLETVKLNLEPVKEAGLCLGVALVIEEAVNIHVSPDAIGRHGNNLQAMGDELIRKTLEQTNYNISRAAKILGIDRTTIYRRMRKWS